MVSLTSMLLKDLYLLVVDDEIDIIEMAVDFLGDEGVRARGVLSPKEALELLSQESFHVIISDMTMPGGISGESFLKLVREKYQKSHLFYFSTGNLDVTDESVKAIGADGVLIKPYRYAELVDRIKKHFNIS